MGEVCPFAFLTGDFERMRTMRTPRLMLLLLAAALLVTGALAFGGTFAIEEKLELTGEETKLDDTVAFDVSVMQVYPDGAKPLMVNGAVNAWQVDWCPNRSEIVYLQLQNNEDFPVEMTLTMDVNALNHSDMFAYAAVPGITESTNPCNNWEDFAAKAAHTGNLVNDASLYVLQKVTVWPNSIYDCALGLHMNKEATAPDPEDKEPLMSLGFTFTVNANEPGTLTVDNK